MRLRSLFDRLPALLKNRYFIVTVIFSVDFVFDNNSIIGWFRALKDYNENKSQQRYYKEQILQTESPDGIAIKQRFP